MYVYTHAPCIFKNTDVDVHYCIDQSVCMYTYVIRVPVGLQDRHLDSPTVTVQPVCTKKKAWESGGGGAGEALPPLFAL